MLPNYDQPLFRPPSEGNSLIFQVTLGCSWNECSFCDMYTSKQFKPRKFEDIKKEILQAAQSFPNTEKVFLADGDALVLSNNKLLPILELIRNNFPKLKRVTSYAMPKNILNKSLEDLKTLKEAGLNMVYYGVESGDETVLKKIRKGATHDEIVQGILKAKQAGIKVSTTNLIGVGGKKYTKQHAQNTAKLLSKANPDFISYLMVMFPLGEERFLEAFGDDYVPLNQKELIEELKQTLTHLNVTGSVVRANHASNYLPVKANFPEDKDSVLKMIDGVLSGDEESLIRPEHMRGL
jgi:radical SAM superfamily enzyme YgiQ (UPF0313 family)